MPTPTFTPETKENLWLLRLLPYLIIVLLTASYLNTLNSPAVLDDEHSFIFTNLVQIRELSFTTLNSLRKSTFGMSRLLPMLSLAVNNYYSQGQAPIYHITNILIHLATFLALAFFLEQLLKLASDSRIIRILSPRYFLWAVAGLWALNPVQTNAITYIVQRMAAICALFYILSLALYLKGRTTPSRRQSLAFLAGAAVSAICSMLSKENSVTLPFAMLLLEELFISPGSVSCFVGKFSKRHWLIIIAACILLAPLSQSAMHNYITGPFSCRPFTLTERLLTETRVVSWYISLLLLPLPSRMNLDHDFAISHSLFSPLTTPFAIIFLISLVWLAFAWRRKRPLLSFGILFFFLNLLTESTVAPLELVFEHRLYLPSVGFFIVLLAVLDWTLDTISPLRLTKNLSIFLILGLIIVLSLSSLLTTLRNNDWRDDLSIYRDMAEKSPNKARPLSNYGMTLARTKQSKLAIEYLNRAFAAGRPHEEGYYGTASNLFLAYKDIEGPEKALQRTIELMRHVPADADLNYLDKLHHNLAYTYYELKQYDTSLAYIQRAIFLFSTDQNQLSVALCIKILSDAYDDPLWREKLALNEPTKEEAVGVKIVTYLIEARDYTKAQQLINELEAVSPERAKHLDKTLQNVMSLNQHAAELSDLYHDQNYINDRSFRWNIKLADFILGYYRPLKPLARILLQKAAQRFPDDLFVNLMQVRMLLESDPTAAKKIISERLLSKFPDFPPLLEMIMDVYKNDQPAAVYQAAEHLLTIYPATPRWKSILFFVSTYQPDKKG